jgi:hypothetical protein
MALRRRATPLPNRRACKEAGRACAEAASTAVLQSERKDRIDASDADGLKEEGRGEENGRSGILMPGA